MRWCALLFLLAAGTASAQCPGDCNGDGEVRIEELVLGVRIALGEPLALCPAFDATPDGVVRIDELVRAAGNALDGCPATPTVPPSPSATPSASASATPTVSATPSATPTIPPVAGAWREEPLAIAASTCLEIFNDFLADEFTARGACAQVVEQLGEDSVRVTDCSAQAVEGALARDGTIALAFPPATVTLEECALTLTVTSAIPAASSPTTAHYVFDLAFGGSCDAIDDCVVEAEGVWTRTDPAPLAR